VGIFIFLSGYFNKTDQAGLGLWTYYKQRLPRLLIPYLIWSVATILFHSIRGVDYTISKIIVALLSGDYQLYFIIVLVQLVIISPLVNNILELNSQKWNIILLAITPIYLLLTIYSSNFVSFYGKLFPGWFIFYFLGMYAKKKETFLDSSSLVLLIFTLLFVLALSIGEAYLLLEYMGSPPFSSSQLTFGSIAYTLILIAIILTVLRFPLSSNSILVKIGERSFGIFFIHTFYIIFFTKLISKIEIDSLFKYISQQMFLVLATLIASYVSIIIFENIFGINNAKRLGLR
jgi:peptidoglycan/LPS O-acetylase OafA/YrhL